MRWWGGGGGGGGEEGKQIVISGDRAPVDMEELDARIASRLQCGLVVDLHPTGLRGCALGVLQHKAEQAMLRNPQIPAGRWRAGIHGAAQSRPNIRVVEGALTRLFAFADLVRREVTIEMVQDCLSDILRLDRPQGHAGPDHQDDLRLLPTSGRPTINRWPAGARAVARPRQKWRCICRRALTTRSYPEIARKLGGRDHTTVLYGVRKIEEAYGGRQPDRRRCRAFCGRHARGLRPVANAAPRRGWGLTPRGARGQLLEKNGCADGGGG